VLKGKIISVISADPREAESFAEGLGKKKEEGKFYRKSGEDLISVLVPKHDEIFSLAEAVSISDYFCFLNREVNKEEAEIALLLESSNRDGCVASQDEDTFKKYFASFSIARKISEKKVQEDKVQYTKDLGFAYIDSAFIVKGVGPVILGFSFSSFKVHQKIKLLPSLKEAEIKSIQVLDEDYEEVGPGIRFGFALKGVEEKDLKASYAAVTESVGSFSSKLKVYKLSIAQEAQNLHAFLYGMKIFGELKNDTLVLSNQVPFVSGKAILLNVNAQPNRLRVYGWGEPVLS
jgi:Selenocysteine-specific translation elongation factor